MKLKNTEDIYGLSPLQKGIRFHNLYAPSSGVYFRQVLCSLSGPLDTHAFSHAWQLAVDRHPILRTSFYWEELEEPVQVVLRKAKLRLESEDWSELAEDGQAEQLRELLEDDRRRGFDFSRPPLMRL